MKSRREKGKRAKLKTGASRKQSTPKFPKNKHFLPPDTHTYVSEGKKCLFFGNFGVLCFLETPILRFTLLPYFRRSIGQKLILIFLFADSPASESVKVKYRYSYLDVLT